MSRRLPQSALLLLLAVGSTGAAAVSDETAPPTGGDRKTPPAPRDVELVVHEPALVMSRWAYEDAFEELVEADPARFRQADGYYEDSRGEFVWDEDEEIYWQVLSPEVLTRGRQDYVQFCASCHGLEGDGYGRSAQALRPPPRSFQQGSFKFTKVPGGMLPSDEALVDLIKHGLDGTPMLPWAISDERLHDIVQYIKSLSPPEQGWRDAVAEVGDVVETGEDPWAGREAEAIAAGELAYHRHQCFSCHPAYATPARVNELRGTLADTAYPETLTWPKLTRDSSYEVLGYRVAIVPPDFTWHTMRHGRDARAVFQSIAAGIGGAGMPTWKGAVPDEEIWALAQYVRHLVDEYKDKPARDGFMAGLRAGQ